MKLADARDAYYDHSASLSAVNRQLCFAGIAVIWIFAVADNASNVALPTPLHLPLLLLVCALAFDLLHYIASTLAWGWFHRHHEKKEVPEVQGLEAPPQINWPAQTFMFLKVLCNAAGLTTLIYFIGSRLS